MLCIDLTEFKQESDSLRNHKISIRTVSPEKSMDNQTFEYLITEDSGMKITLEFPQSSQNDSVIAEVKCVLAGILNEYLEKIS